MQKSHLTTQTSKQFAFRSKPFAALKAGIRFLLNVEDTEQFFRLTDAIDGRQNEKNYQSYVKTPVGTRLNAALVDFGVLLEDHAYLARQPADSLAQAYLQFLKTEDLDMGLLMGAEADAQSSALLVDEARRAYMRNGIALHDILHIVTGYGRDPVGEACLLAFTAEQFSLTGVGLAARGLAWREQCRNFGTPVLAMVREAREHARQSVWVQEIDWRDYFARPVSDARRDLRLPVARTYLKHFRECSACLESRTEKYPVVLEAA